MHRHTPSWPAAVATAWFACSSMASAGDAGTAPAQPGEEGVDRNCDVQPDECGKDAFDAGVRAFQKGDFAEALKLFQRAYGFKKHPAVALNLGLAESKNGLFLEAAQRFESVENDPHASDAIKQSARQERDAAERSIATVTIDAAGQGNVTAEIDGAAVTGTPPSARLNPGRHAVKVHDGAKLVIERNVVLQPGEHLRIALERASQITVVPQHDTGTRPQEASRGLHPAWLYASAGVTVALGAVTVWSGLDTNSAYDSYERDLPGLNQDEIDRRVDEGNGKETRTNVLIAVTAAAAVGTTALGLFAIDWGRDGTGRGASAAVLPGGLAVSGRF